MPFPETIKHEAKKKANFKCCICQAAFVEVHHIVPQAEGGADELENAAPLCGGCHQRYGGNPELRKQLHQMRDNWWRMCSSQIHDNSIYAKLDELGDDVSAIKNSLIPFMEGHVDKLRKATSIGDISTAYSYISTGTHVTTTPAYSTPLCPYCGGFLTSDGGISYTCQKCHPQGPQ